MICSACSGTGWLRTQRNVSKIYGRTQFNTYTRPCPCCGATGKVELPPFDRKQAAAGDVPESLERV
jgi:hypothetical protein